MPLPSRIHAVTDFMDGGETNLRDKYDHHWPIKSYRSRPPLTSEQKSLINKNECPKCGGLLACSEIICGGEKGMEGICTKCGARWFPDQIEEPIPNLFPRGGKRPPVGKKVYREFTCKHCGKLVQGLAARNACYCPGTTCYEDARRIANREAYRKVNSLSRNLGV